MRVGWSAGQQTPAASVRRGPSAAERRCSRGAKPPPRFEDPGEGVKIEESVQNPPVERFDIRILGRLAGRDEVQSDAFFDAPGRNRQCLHDEVEAPVALCEICVIIPAHYRYGDSITWFFRTIGTARANTRKTGQSRYQLSSQVSECFSRSD